MKAVTIEPTVPSLSRTRFADYVELTKPRIAVLVLFTVGAGALLASRNTVDLLLIFNAVFGTALIAGGASALNQLMERQSDALMRRTEQRPLPAGRLGPAEVAAFGMALAAIGTIYLVVTLGQPWAAAVALLSFVSYVCIYTPLKRRTHLNTLVGAVPGALPPVIGWVAVRGSLDAEAVMLFLLLFLWQIPHFLAIAWMYREEYGRAGLQMLPVVDPDGRYTSVNMITYCLALIPVSLLPVFLGWAGPIYVVGASALGLAFLWSAVRFARERTRPRARAVLRLSLLYLPGVLALLMIHGLTRPGAPWAFR